MDEKDFGKSNEKFAPANGVSPCEIQRLCVAAVEGVKIDYPGGRKGLTIDYSLARELLFAELSLFLCLIPSPNYSCARKQKPAVATYRHHRARGRRGMDRYNSSFQDVFATCAAT